MTFDGERRILPEHELLIIDEAHDLTDRVTSAAQAEFSADALARAAKRAGHYFGSREVERLDDAAEALRTSLDAHLPGRMPAVPEGVRAAVLLAEEACQSGLRGIGKVGADDADLAGKHQAKASLQVLVETAQRLLLESDQDVIWLSTDDRGKRSLVVAPLSVAGLLGRELFRDRVVVATSATLALGGQFETVGRSLGLPRQQDAPAAPTKDDNEDGPPRWHGEDVGSPFDYPRQGILYVAAHLPRPGMSGLSDGAAEELVKLVQAAGGRTLGLFSSRKAAAAAAEILSDRTDLPILLQGEDSLPLLVRKFKEDPATCLLGVMSLWQGVDVPGPACQLVVIDRLPFPRPDDPLTSARAAAAAVDSAGGSGFSAVSVPIAAIRLAQGAGRLVRTSDDRGVVAVLDPRLATQRYGTYLRRSVPPFWYTTKQETVLAALQRLSVDAAASS